MGCAVVLLPGLDGLGSQFAPLVEALSPDVPTVVVPYPDVPMDYEAHQRVAASALPRDRDYVILGESFSGPVAVSLAAESPRGLLGCILCASFLRSPHRLLALVAPFLGLLPPQRVPSRFSDFLVMGRFATPSLRQMQLDARRNVSAATLVARLKAVAHVNVSDTLRGLTLPTLYLRASEDRLVPRGAGEHFAALARSGRVVDIEGPHFLLQAKPVEAAAAIREFLTGLA